MTGPRSRVALYAAIRRDARAGLSGRALKRKHGVGLRHGGGRVAVRVAGEPRKKQEKRGSRLDPCRPVIDGWLCTDQDAPRKQRHTAKRIFDRLLGEHHAAGIVSYGMVRDFVATRRREIRVSISPTRGMTVRLVGTVSACPNVPKLSDTP